MEQYISKKDFRKIINEAAQSAKNAASQSSGEPDYDKVELVQDKNVLSGKDWAKYGGNFPIKRNGKIYWVSRSVTVSMYAFCQDKWGNWCILANQRGPGCKTHRGLWNVPAGYLDYGETAEQAAGRETWEETGVDIPDNVIRHMGTSTESETVRMRFSCVLPDTIEDYPVTAENSEPGEVSNVAWIPTLDAHGKPAPEIFKYQWVRRPKDMIAQAYTMLSHLWLPKDAKMPKDKIIQSLKNEIRGNARANLLLDELLKYMKN